MMGITLTVFWIGNRALDTPSLYTLWTLSTVKLNWDKPHIYMMCVKFVHLLYCPYVHNSITYKHNSNFTEYLLCWLLCLKTCLCTALYPNIQLTLCDKQDEQTGNKYGLSMVNNFTKLIDHYPFKPLNRNVSFRNSMYMLKHCCECFTWKKHEAHGRDANKARVLY